MTSPWNDLTGRTVVLIGGGTGIGREVARMVVDRGGAVLLGGRDAGRLDTAASELGPAASYREVDTSVDESVTAFFSGVDRVDAIFTTAATYRVGSLADLSLDDAASPMQSKFWGQYRVVKAALPLLSADASIVLTSGAASARPAGAAPAYVAANAAIEGLARGLAVELAPIRVNAIAPGTIDGHLWAHRPVEDREAAFSQFEGASLLRRTGTEAEIAHAVLHLFTNGFTTGSTLYVDGGYTLR